MKQLQRETISSTRTDYDYGYEINTVNKCKFKWFTFQYESRTYHENATEDEPAYDEASSELSVVGPDCLEVIAIDCVPWEEIYKYVEEHKGKLNFHYATTDDVCKELHKRSVISDYATFRKKCRSYSFFQLRWLYKFGIAHKDLWLYELDPQDEVDVPKLES